MAKTEKSEAPKPAGFQYKEMALPFLAVFTALVVGALLIWPSGASVYEAYKGLFEGMLGSTRALVETCVSATPYILLGLSVAIGFKCALFNIGAEGQFFIGALCASIVGFSLKGLPPIVHLPLSMAAAAMGGAMWGAIPGYLKARFGAHEVINTIMLNYIAVNLVDFLVKKVFRDPNASVDRTPYIEKAAELPHLIGPDLRLHAGFLVAFAGVIFVYWLLNKTTIGFEIRTVGANPGAARCAGMSVKKNTVLVMSLAGGLAGLAGAGEVLGLKHNLPAAFSSGYGFDSIAVALLAKSNPIAIIPAAFLWGGLRNGAGLMQVRTGISIDLINVIQALVIVFVAADPIVRWLYRLGPKVKSKSHIFKGMGQIMAISRKYWNSERGLATAFIIIGLFFLWCALTFPSQSVSKLRFSTLGILPMSTTTVFYVLAAIGIISGGICFQQARRETKLHQTCLGINAFCVFLAVLVWGAMGRRLDVVGVLTQSLRLATPIALGAMAGILCERTGIVNIAIEGMMLSSACVGFTGALYSHSMLVGLFMAILCGMAMAGLHAVLSIQYRVDQIISGTVINILAVGVTGFLRRSFLINSDLEGPGVFPIWRIPVLSDIPVIGQIFFRHQPMVYVMMILVVFIHLMLFHSRWGLRTRTVGEHPRAADTLGVNVYFTRYMNVILAGGVAGLAGAWFSLETVGHFNDLMTGGKGFIALAAMIFGKWTPFGAAGGALLFGAADAIQIKLQIAGVAVPYQFLSMAPYIVTMIVLAGIVGRAVSPAATGQPYERQ